MATAVLACACNNARNNSVKAAKVANDQKEIARENVVSDQDALFAVNAANAGMAEVAASKVALDRTQNTQVKDFASMMVTDHSRANDNLKQLAVHKNITLPDSVSPDVRRHVEDLRTIAISKFDKAYMDMMVKDHDKVVGDFNEAVKTVQDSDIRAFVSQVLPTLIKHQQEAKTIQADLSRK